MDHDNENAKPNSDNNTNSNDNYKKNNNFIKTEMGYWGPSAIIMQGNSLDIFTMR